MTTEIFDPTVCTLGEGPLWHPELGQLFWFDIMGKALLSRAGGETQRWGFDEHVSAAGWLDRGTLMIASETALIRFDLASGKSETVVPLEAGNPRTRSNDGRADPWGGFWIGTMGKNAEDGAGAIYRYFRGELRQLYAPITISNAICFSPDRRFAYFADTRARTVWRQTLKETDGWPLGGAEVFLDFTRDGINPDGAVCDADGFFWNAQWGAARLSRFNAAGALISEIPLPTDHITCPAFGGSDLRTLYATSATQGLGKDKLAAQPDAGKTFATAVHVAGQEEHRVVL
ncbi:MAG: SMP-30/gluconolactonase/LRE family protein [Paracoccaceae bacterium]